jgi:hypothetical protein
VAAVHSPYWSIGLHWPRDAQRFAARSLYVRHVVLRVEQSIGVHALSSVAATQKPLVLQRSHTAPHASRQHRPSTQKPDWHWFGSLHVCPGPSFDTHALFRQYVPVGLAQLEVVLSAQVVSHDDTVVSHSSPALHCALAVQHNGPAPSQQTLFWHFSPVLHVPCPLPAGVGAACTGSWPAGSWHPPEALHT